MKAVNINHNDHYRSRYLAVLFLAGLSTACSINQPKQAIEPSSILKPAIAPQTDGTECINPEPPANKNSVCPLSEVDVKCFKDETDRQAVINSFTNGRCEYHKLSKDTVFYRYFDSIAGKKGGYYTLEEVSVDNPQDNLHNEIIQKLALVQEWGNSAKMEEAIVFPKGTVVYQGTAAPQGNNEVERKHCYPGGAQQTYILYATQQDLFGKNRVWFSEPHDVVYTGKPLFTCPP